MRARSSYRDLFLRIAPVAAPGLLTLLLCAWRIGTSQLWQDEHSTWWATQLSRADFARLLGNVDLVHAPYYLLMRAVTRLFGDSEAALRVPSALAMSGCAVLTAGIGRRLFDATVGLRAGLMFALVPLVSRFGQEARSYAFAALLATSSTWLMLRYLERPASPGRALTYGTSIVALGLTHLIALLVLCAHLACCLTAVRATSPHLRIQTARLWSLGKIISAACVVLAPFLLCAATQSDQINDIALPNLTIKNLSRALGSRDGVLQAAMGLSLVAALFTPRAGLMLRVWAAGPILFLVATHDLLHMFRLRYLMFTVPAWALLAAVSLDRLLPSYGARYRITACAAAVLVVFGWNMQTQFRSALGHASADYRALGRLLRQRARPDDGLAFGGSRGGARHARLAMAYELRGHHGLYDVFAAQSMAQRGLFSAKECAGACLPDLMTRLWLVTRESPSHLFEGMPEPRAQLLRERFSIVQIITHAHATLALLSARSPGVTSSRARRSPEHPRAWMPATEATSADP